MPTIVVNLDPLRVQAGYPGAAHPIYQRDFSERIWPEWPGTLSPHDLGRLRNALLLLIIQMLDAMLVTATKMHLVLIEPVLLPLGIKSLLAHIILSDLRCVSLAFLPASVCSCLSAGASEGIVLENSSGETIVTPVYDMKELTPLIKATRFPNGGLPEGESVDDDTKSVPVLINEITRSLSIDLRKPLPSTIVLDESLGSMDLKGLENHQSYRSRGRWLGGSVITKEFKLVRGTSRQEFLSETKTVFDSLFDKW